MCCVWPAGIEVADNVGQDHIEKQGSANTEWQSDIEGLQAVYESMVEVAEPSSVLYSLQQNPVSPTACHVP